MNSLTGTVDGTIGIDTGALFQLTVAIIRVAEGARQWRTSLILIGIGKDLHTVVGILGLIDIFALGIGHHIRLVELLIAQLFLNMQTGLGDRLTRCGTHHHKTHAIIYWLGFGDGVDIRHEIQTTNNVRRRGGLKLHHIHAHRQTLERKRVLKQFVRGLTLVGMLLLEHHLTQKRLDLLITFLIRGRDVDRALGIHTIHLHGER